MILSALFSFIVSLIDMLDISLPTFPPTVLGAFTTFSSYIPGALNLLRAFLGDSVFTQISILFSLFVDLQAFKYGWSLFWWVVKKIPILNIG